MIRTRIAAVALAAVGAASMLAACDATDAAGLTTKEVTYEITSSSGTASIVTYSVAKGQQQESSVKTPWKKTVEVDIAVLSASNDGDGEIACKITKGDKVISENKSSGQYANVTCNQ